MNLLDLFWKQFLLKEKIYDKSENRASLGLPFSHSNFQRKAARSFFFTYIFMTKTGVMHEFQRKTKVRMWASHVSRKRWNVLCSCMLDCRPSDMCLLFCLVIRRHTSAPPERGCQPRAFPFLLKNLTNPRICETHKRRKICFMSIIPFCLAPKFLSFFFFLFLISLIPFIF